MASDSSSDDEDLYCNDDALHERWCCARKVARAAHGAGPEGAAKLAKLEAVLRDAIQTPDRRRLILKSTSMQKLLTLAGAHDCFILAGFMPSGACLVLVDAAVPEAQATVKVLRLVVEQFPSALPPASAPAPRIAVADSAPTASRQSTSPAAPPLAAAADDEQEEKEKEKEKEPPSLVGCRVELVGIGAKPELNGRQGLAVSFDAAKGRYNVRLDGSLAAESMLALRPDNVRVVAGVSQSQGSPEPVVALPPLTEEEEDVNVLEPVRGSLESDHDFQQQCERG